MGSNEHIINYLSYFTQNHSPGFAVLLDGEWGAGKTYFVNKFISMMETKSDPLKFVYISLYGVSSNKEIDEQMFQQLHPILSSRPVTIATKMIKGLVKTTLKVDFQKNGTNFETKFGMPDLDTLNFINRLENAVLVFDDLERCHMPVSKVLGYINQFVEHQHHRTIIIANERIIAEKEIEQGAEFNYKEIKEKLIGRTFTIRSDVTGALESFINDTPEASQNILRANGDLILKTYNLSTYDNLRSLKQGIREISRLIEFLPKYALENDEFVSHVIEATLIFTFELRKGLISTDDISRFVERTYNRSTKEPGQIHPCKVIEEKYSHFRFHEMCPNAGVWSAYLKQGSIPEKDLETAIEHGVYFQDSNTPDWMKLWNYIDLNDKEFDLLFEKVRKDFSKFQYTNPGIILHISAMFLKFARIEVIDQTIEEMYGQIIETIDEMGAGNLVKEEDSANWMFGAYLGLGFMDSGSTYFSKVHDRLSKISENARVMEYPKLAEELLNLAQQDPKTFWTKMDSKLQTSEKFSLVPIFTYMDAAAFATAVELAPNGKKYHFTYLFKDRYQMAAIHKDLLKEGPWLIKLKKHLEKIIKSKHGQQPLTMYLLKSIVSDGIDPAIASIANAQKIVLS